MIAAENVSFSYGKGKLLTGLDLRAERGECVVLAGPNGSGKSTALSLLAGVLKPDGGKVTAEGKLGFVPQGTALFEDATVGENLAFFAGLARCPVPETLPFGVERLKKSRVSRLSGGTKKQVSIACALLGDPEILLLDEPCSALDPEYRAELTELLLSLKARGKAIVYVSHEPLEFAPFYDRLLFFGDTLETYDRKALSGEPAEDMKLRENFTALFQKNRK